MKKSVIVALGLAIVIILWGSSGQGLEKALDLAAQDICQGMADDVTFDPEVLEKIKSLPDTLVSARFEILKESDEEASVVLHWNALDDMHDVGQIPMQAVEAGQGWYFQLPKP